MKGWLYRRKMFTDKLPRQCLPAKLTEAMTNMMTFTATSLTFFLLLDMVNRDYYRIASFYLLTKLAALTMLTDYFTWTVIAVTTC